ncbi:unnamed protein product [Trypanosoma congolense IL3000]|uniref:WGS project CAEQ00000000 data, annotated contig 2036 n=1 Tax=Trypanosoma congolense (strain IL3000) TaxID=1068625 RepID=F9WAY9_TRYCI|nr:unnamed protein product [Trypanosoma congolense IL3000]
MSPWLPPTIKRQQAVVAQAESVSKPFSLFVNLVYPMSSIASTNLRSPPYISASCMLSGTGSSLSSPTPCPSPGKQLPKLLFPAAHVFPMHKCPSPLLALTKSIIIFTVFPLTSVPWLQCELFCTPAQSDFSSSLLVRLGPLYKFHLLLHN